MSKTAIRDSKGRTLPDGVNLANFPQVYPDFRSNDLEDILDLLYDVFERHKRLAFSALNEWKPLFLETAEKNKAIFIEDLDAPLPDDIGAIVISRENLRRRWINQLEASGVYVFVVSNTKPRIGNVYRLPTFFNDQVRDVPESLQKLPTSIEAVKKAQTQRTIELNRDLNNSELVTSLVMELVEKTNAADESLDNAFREIGETKKLLSSITKSREKEDC